MRHNVKQEFREAMDALSFSRQEKAEMTQRLLRHTQPAKTISGRKLLVLSLAAILILTTMTAAAIYNHWPDSLMYNGFSFSEQDKQRAEQSGLAVFPRNISATDQGVTISLVQTMMDPYRCILTFRVEGLELPEGANPSLKGWEVTMSNRAPTSGSMEWFPGLAQITPEVVTYADGSPIQRDEDGWVIPRLADEDGSLIFTVTYTYEEAQPNATQVTARCSGIEIVGEPPIPLVEGSWVLSWTLTGSDQIRVAEPNAQVGRSGFVLQRVELSSLTALLEFSGGGRIPRLEAVLLKDGTRVRVPGGTICCNQPGEKDGYLSNVGIQAVDVEQIAALIFDCNEDAPIEIPIS